MHIGSKEELQLVWDDFLLQRHRRVMIAYAPDVDAICALVSLQTLLQRSQKEFVPHLCENDGSASFVAEVCKDPSITAVFLLNCTFRLQDDMDHLLFALPARTMVYVFDAHLPLPQSRLFQFPNQTLMDDGDVTEAMLDRADNMFLFMLPQRNPKLIQKGKEDKKTQKDKKSDEKEVEPDYFTQRGCVRFPCAYVMLELSHVVTSSDVSDRDMAWRAIVATTHYYLHDWIDRDWYSVLVQLLRAELSGLGRNDEVEAASSYKMSDDDDEWLKKTMPVRPNRKGEIRSAIHYRFVLSRYCSLWQTLHHSPITHAAWNVHERKEMLAALGIPLQNAQQLPASQIRPPPLSWGSIPVLSNPDPFHDRAVDAFCDRLDGYNHSRHVIATLALQMVKEPPACINKAFGSSTIPPLDRSALFYESFSLMLTPNLEIDAADVAYVMNTLLDDKENGAVNALDALTCTDETVFLKFVTHTLAVYADMADMSMRLHATADDYLPNGIDKRVKTRVYHVSETKSAMFPLLTTFLLAHCYASIAGQTEAKTKAKAETTTEKKAETKSKKAARQFRVMLCISLAKQTSRSNGEYEMIIQHPYPVGLTASNGTFQFPFTSAREQECSSLDAFLPVTWCGVQRECVRLRSLSLVESIQYSQLYTTKKRAT